MLPVRLFPLFEGTEDRRRETEDAPMLRLSESFAWVALLAEKRIYISGNNWQKSIYPGLKKTFSCSKSFSRCRSGIPFAFLQG